jgi:hypothetical protein
MSTNSVSFPSTRRRVAAGLIVAVALLLGLLIKLARDHGILPLLLPLDLGGTSPSFIIPFAVPFALLAQQREVRWIDALKNAGFAGLGMVAYEVLQLWLPGRTYDSCDIVAALLGSGVGAVAAGALFFRQRSMP